MRQSVETTKLQQDQESQSKTAEQSGEVRLPKVNIKKDELLEKKLLAVNETIPETAQLGTTKDRAFQKLQAEVDKLITKHTPPINQKVDSLHETIQNDGAFDPMKFRQRMLEFKEGVENQKTILPEEVQKIKNKFDQLKEDLKPESTLRDTVKKIDSEKADTIFKELIKSKYIELTKELHSFEKKER